MWPWLSGKQSTSPRTELVFEHDMYNVNKSGVWGSMRSGQYKLIVGPKGGEAQASWYGWFSPNQSDPNPSLNYYACGNDKAPGGCLFDLSVDPTEHNDLAKSQPGIFNSLLSKFRSFDTSCHPPVNNPPSDEAGLCAAALNAGRYEYLKERFKCSFYIVYVVCVCVYCQG